jgi:seryl-tRNA synthetase
MLSLSHVLGKPYITLFPPHLLSDDCMGAHTYYKQWGNSLYAIGKYTHSLCATSPTCHTHTKLPKYHSVAHKK